MSRFFIKSATYPTIVIGYDGGVSSNPAAQQQEQCWNAAAATATLQPAALTQLWMLTADGHIVSCANPGYALDIDSSNVVYVAELDDVSSQQWTFKAAVSTTSGQPSERSYLIVSQSDQLYLNGWGRIYAGLGIVVYPGPASYNDYWLLTPADSSRVAVLQAALGAPGEATVDVVEDVQTLIDAGTQSFIPSNLSNAPSGATAFGMTYKVGQTVYSAAGAPGDTIALAGNALPVVLAASYGAPQGATWGVGAVVQALINAGTTPSVQIAVNTTTFGGDPAYGYGKSFAMTYLDCSGDLQAVACPDNSTITIDLTPA